jgi:hypothetical protein
MNKNAWGSRETVPSACATWWGSDRGYKIGIKDTVFAFIWGTCTPINETVTGNPAESLSDDPAEGFDVYTDSSQGLIRIKHQAPAQKLDVRLLIYPGGSRSRFPVPAKNSLFIPDSR